MNSKQKGNRGEVQVVNLLKRIGINAWTTRSLQAANARQFDVDWPGCRWAIEVKIGRSWTVPSAWRQAVKQAEGSGRIPVLIARRDRGPWEVWAHNGDLPYFSRHWPKLVDGAELQWCGIETWLALVKLHEEAPKVCAHAV